MGVRQHVLTVDAEYLPHLSIVTLKPSQRGQAVITCDQLYEIDTHYIGGRTLPCLDSECTACKAEFARKYEGYCSLIWVANRRHEILRLTRNAALMLKSQLGGRKSYRGSGVVFERKGKRPNGRVEAHVEAMLNDPSKLPQAPEIELYLARVWQVDGITVTGDAADYIRRLSDWTQLTIEKGRANDAKEA